MVDQHEDVARTPRRNYLAKLVKFLGSQDFVVRTFEVLRQVWPLHFLKKTAPLEFASECSGQEDATSPTEIDPESEDRS